MKQQQYEIRILFLFFLLNSMSGFGNEISLSLNGSWSFTHKGGEETTLPVPGFYGWTGNSQQKASQPTSADSGPLIVFEDTPEGTYRKTFQIPQTFNGKRIFLYFGSIHFMADITLNGRHIKRHAGGYVPVEIDITKNVRLSGDNHLQVDIVYWESSFVDGNGMLLWPVGFYNNFSCLGITGEVRLISRSDVYIENIKVHTSVSQNRLDAGYQIVNAGSTTRFLTLTGRVDQEGTVRFALGETSLTIAPGETIQVDLGGVWTGYSLWWPHSPELYHITGDLLESGTLMHSKTDRFGFREFKREGDHFTLNGVRTNLRGDNVTFYSEKDQWHWLVPTPERWAAVVDTMKALNFNAVRLNSSPHPDWMLDICDEKGLMVIAESAIMCLNNTPYRSETYATNCRSWLKKWIKHSRNRPSIVIWSAENEMYHYGHRRCTLDQIRGFETAITEMDTTRPVVFEGDFDLEGYADVYSYHYIYPYPNGWPGGSIYELADYLRPDKPTSYGEFVWIKGWNVPASDVSRRQCIQARAARTVGFSDIRPFRLDWAWHPNSNFPQRYEIGWQPSKDEKDFLRKTYHPVAVYDRGYNEFRPDVYIREVDENQFIYRRLVVFNDDHEDTAVKLRYRLILGGVAILTESFDLDIPIGESVEQYIEFRAPYVPFNQSMNMELTTWKNGQRRFRDTYPFWIVNKGVDPPRFVAPQQVTGLILSRDQNRPMLQWSAVTKDVEGQAESIDHYRVYRSTDCFNAHSETVRIDDLAYRDDQFTGVNDTNLNIYYRISAVDDTGLESAVSDIVTDFEYMLTNSASGLTHIAMPVMNNNLPDAAALLAYIPNCLSVAAWETARQDFVEYNPAEPASNFDVYPGQVLRIRSSENQIIAFQGFLADPSYVFSDQSDAPNYFAIMAPVRRRDITEASDLLEAVENGNAVACWETAAQHYKQYDSVFPDSDFPIRPGWPYLIHITKAGVWP